MCLKPEVKVFFFDNVRKEEERKPSIALTGQAGRWSDTGGNDAVNSSSLAENSSITQWMCWAKKRGEAGSFVTAWLFHPLSKHLSECGTLLLSSSWFEKITLLLIVPIIWPSVLSLTASSFYSFSFFRWGILQIRVKPKCLLQLINADKCIGDFFSYAVHNVEGPKIKVLNYKSSQLQKV